MSEYGLILTTLREFDLITEEQMESAWAEYQQAVIESQERVDKFREEWKSTRSWWRRFWGSWYNDWIDHELKGGGSY